MAYVMSASLYLHLFYMIVVLRKTYEEQTQESQSFHFTSLMVF